MIDAQLGRAVRAFIKTLFALAEPPSPPPPRDATVVLTVHPPTRKDARDG
jgi:hypothetical protein